jgi:hypothetical protein
MNPYVLFYAFLIFLACLFLHILIWRVRLPVRQIPLLGIIFIVLPLTVVIIIYLFLGFSNVTGFRSLSRTDLLAVFLLHFSLAGVYIFSYPAAQAISPSLKMLLYIRSSRGGSTLEELLSGFDERELFEERIRDLIGESLVAEGPDGIELTFSGKRLVGVFIFIRRLLGLPIGKG